MSSQKVTWDVYQLRHLPSKRLRSLVRTLCWDHQLSKWCARNARRNWAKWSPRTRGRQELGIQQKAVAGSSTRTRRSPQRRPVSPRTANSPSAVFVARKFTRWGPIIAKAAPTRRESAPCAGRKSWKPRTIGKRPLECLGDTEMSALLRTPVADPRSSSCDPFSRVALCKYNSCLT